MSVVVHPSRLRQEMTRRGWDAAHLAKEARISPATVGAALAGRPIAARSLGLIVTALSRTPAMDLVDMLTFVDRPESGLE